MLFKLMKLSEILSSVQKGLSMFSEPNNCVYWRSRQFINRGTSNCKTFMVASCKEIQSFFMEEHQSFSQEFFNKVYILLVYAS